MDFRLPASAKAVLCLLLTACLRVSSLAEPVSLESTLPPDFLDRITQADGSIRFTLPNGHPIVGKISRIERANPSVRVLEGIIQHPDPGDFSFRLSSGTPPTPEGFLRFTGKTTEWRILPDPQGKLRLSEVQISTDSSSKPPEDLFRPRHMVPPLAPNRPDTPAREAQEAELRKNLSIEKIGPGTLRIGEVTLEQTTRRISFSGKVNQREGPVEYAVVTQKGKCHEATFSTTASPRDIHLALLLLGIKPSDSGAPPGQAITVPEPAAVRVTFEWEHEGQLQSYGIHELIHFQGTTPLPDRYWLYNGSRFNDAGFAAVTDGSIISLIADDLALINNPGSDRSDDKSHTPNTRLLPPVGTPVTIRITLNKPNPKPEHTPR